MSSPATSDASNLEERVAELEKKDRQNQLFVMMKEKKDLLNAEMKSYSDNLLIKGLKFSIKAAQKDEAAEEEFRVYVLKTLVDQGLVPAKKLFVPKGEDKGSILRGVLRHAHPLGSKDNCTVVVAFLESWFAASINTKLVNGKKLTGGIRVCQHMPLILDALQNEALKARRSFLAADRGRKIILKSTLKAPWIQLIESKDGAKTELAFEVEDSRLANPPLTLAKLEREDKQFIQLPFLSREQKAAIPKATIKPGGVADLDVSLMDLF